VEWRLRLHSPEPVSTIPYSGRAGPLRYSAEFGFATNETNDGDHTTGGRVPLRVAFSSSTTVEDEEEEEVERGTHV